MDVLIVLLPFVLLGVVVLFVAFSGGPGRARELYLTRGGWLFRATLLLIYVGLGIVVPAAVIAGRDEAEGGVGRLEQAELTAREERGKALFERTCKSCHNLDAVGANGVTGPDLDEIGKVTQSRILAAIKNGGTGQQRMPAGLLQGEDAEDVALYLSKVAGQ